MKVTALEYPTAGPPIQIRSPKKRAQRNEITPWSNAGARRCIARDPNHAARRDGAGDVDVGPQKITEPVALLSTSPGNFRPPPCGFFLRPSGAASTYSRSV